MKKFIAILMIGCVVSAGTELKKDEESELVISKYIKDSNSYRLLKRNKVDVDNIYYVSNRCYKNTPNIATYISNKLQYITDFEEAKNTLISSEDFLPMFSHYCRNDKEFIKLDNDMAYAHIDAETNLNKDLLKSLELSLSTLVAYSFLDIYLK